MKRFYPIALLTLFLASCLKEAAVEVAQPETFVRYFNGGGNDKATDFELTSDGGFIILANTEVASTDPSKSSTFRIKLIKTDEYGSIQKQIYFPDVPAEGDLAFKGSFRGGSLELDANGDYVITGENIRYDNFGVIKGTDTFVITISQAGTVTDSASFAFSNRGAAIAVSPTGNLLLLSSKPSSMYLSELDKADLHNEVNRSSWSVERVPTTNTLFLNNSSLVVWAGSETSTNGLEKGVRITSASQTNASPEWSNYWLNPGFERAAFDLTKFGTGYISIGSSNEKVNASGGTVIGTDKDIQYIRYDGSGQILTTKGFPLVDDIAVTVNDGQDDVGNGLYRTVDGGVILLGTANSKAIGGRGETDFVLIKIDPFGTEEFRTHFGSRFKDTGIAVRQIDKGNFVVLGNTNQGGLDMIMLARTDKNGQIQ